MSMPLAAADLTLFAKAPLYAALPPAARQALSERCRIRRLGRGESLFLQGDFAEHLFMVVSGWVKVFRLTSDGGEAVLHIFRAGETFAEPAALGLGHYPANAEAATDSRVLMIPTGALITEIERTPGLAMKIIATLSHRLQTLIAESERRQFLSTPHRVAVFLLELLEASGPPPQTTAATLTLPYDKALVAARLGMTAESFSRAMAKLKPHGVHSQGSTVTVDDQATFRHYCQALMT